MTIKLIGKIRTEFHSQIITNPSAIWYEPVYEVDGCKGLIMSLKGRSGTGFYPLSGMTKNEAGIICREGSPKELSLYNLKNAPNFYSNMLDELPEIKYYVEND